MSAWENERKRRMDKIKEVLERFPRGCTAQTLAFETHILQEITKARFMAYLEELSWSKEIIMGKNGLVRLVK